MTDPARDLGEVLLRALRQVAPVSATPVWVALPGEAKRRGMTTRALRDWCRRHDVEIRESSHRDAWVSPAAIDQAIEGFRTVRRVPPPPGTSADDDSAAERALRARPRPSTRGPGS